MFSPFYPVVQLCFRLRFYWKCPNKYHASLSLLPFCSLFSGDNDVSVGVSLSSVGVVRQSWGRYLSQCPVQSYRPFTHYSVNFHRNRRHDWLSCLLLSPSLVLHLSCLLILMTTTLRGPSSLTSLTKYCLACMLPVASVSLSFGLLSTCVLCTYSPSMSSSSSSPPWPLPSSWLSSLQPHFFLFSLSSLSSHFVCFCWFVLLFTRIVSFSCV